MLFHPPIPTLSPSRFIVVDEYSRTSCESVYAIGDITDRFALTPVALMEGMALANTLFNDKPTKPDHMTVPTAGKELEGLGLERFGESRCWGGVAAK